MSNLFKKASRKQARLKLLIDGPSGSGKTQSAIRIARGLGGKIAVIDTENHSVEKKSDELISGLGICNLEEKTIDNYIKFIKNADENGFTTLIIDSLSHAWQELLQEVDNLAKSKYGGNSFRAWGEGTPKQRRFIDAILNCGCHIIATSRVKTDWVIETNEKGKSAPRKVGLQTEQGKGLEYEFDILMRLNEEHAGHIIKDRFDIGLQDTFVKYPSEEFGAKMLKYFSGGDTVEIEIAQLFLKLGLTDGQKQQARDKYPNDADLLEKLKGEIKND